MNDRQAHEVLGKLKALYPGWKLNDVQTEEWMAAIAAVGWYDLGVRAASILYRDFPYQTPTLEAYRRALSSAASAPTPQAVPTGPRILAYVMCERGEPEHINRTGWYSPIIAPGGEMTGEALDEHCRKIAQKRVEMYGGRWVWMIGWDETQMRLARMKALADSGIQPRPMSPGLAGIFAKAYARLELEPAGG